MKNNSQNNDDFIIGRHPAVAALKADGQEINKVFIQSGLRTGAIV